ncbi:hypothetical protein TB2_025098 [Malus domestica]
MADGVSVPFGSHSSSACCPHHETPHHCELKSQRRVAFQVCHGLKQISGREKRSHSQVAESAMVLCGRGPMRSWRLMGRRALAAVGMLATTNTTTKAVGIVKILGTRALLFSNMVGERDEVGQRGEEGGVRGIGKEKREGSGTGKRRGREAAMRAHRELPADGLELLH